ncbi:MAG: hypothetical protein WD044_13070 [Dongiaceae bacterium]
MTAPKNISIELDWSRLLGFDQTVHANAPTAMAAAMAAKVGDKNFIRREPAPALGAKVGSKTCLRRL